MPASLFDKVTYHLHPSFGDRAVQGTSLLVFFWVLLAMQIGEQAWTSCSRCILANGAAVCNTVFKQPPFRISEEGWGEFDMQIEFTADKSHFIQHDLNFAQERYESKHVIVS